MKCPHCEKDLELPENTLSHIKKFASYATSITLCCGKIVSFTERRVHDAHKARTGLKEDSWGRVPKPTEEATR